MGQTIVEKILATHAGCAVVRPGEFISARVDLVLANDITGVGIEHTLLPEEGLVRPWMVIVGGDSHTCTYGAFGAFGERGPTAR